MSDEPQLKKQENWGSRFGVIAAVAGSAVGLGNFLRFPGTAVNNGGGAFMVPYIISFLILGIPIAWCEWTLGRLGGRYGQNNGPGIMYALWNRWPARAVGALTLVIPIVVYMYYVLLEALCLRYAYAFFSNGFETLFATAQASGDEGVTAAAANFAVETFGLAENGQMLGSSMLYLVGLCFLVNFVIIYRGVAKGIERFCITAMPLLIGCAVIVLIRVLTLDNVVDGRTISGGVGFMWNPDWSQLKDPEVWLRAAGQIFFSLSVGFGLILCYSSYLKKDDDVVLTSLSASSTNEFCEVILGGMIIVPAAFLFLGPSSVAETTTFTTGFITVPAIMHYMPAGWLFGGLWFGLLFMAAVTSSISMLQPAIAFLEDGFNLSRQASVTILGLITAMGAAPVMYFSADAVALDTADFWCEFMMILAGLGQVLIFGWILGAKNGVAEANRGSNFKIPSWMTGVIRYVTPAFLAVVLIMWVSYKGEERVLAMSPSHQGKAAIKEVYQQHLQSGAVPALANLTEDELFAEVDAALEAETPPEWMHVAGLAEQARQAQQAAESRANIVRFVFLAIVLIFIGVVILSDLAARNRFQRVVSAHRALEGNNA